MASAAISCKFVRTGSGTNLIHDLVVDLVFGPPDALSCQIGSLLEGTEHDTQSRSGHEATLLAFDTSYHSRCFLCGRQPAVRRELIDQVRQMLAEAGEQILTSHASLLA